MNDGYKSGSVHRLSVSQFRRATLDKAERSLYTKTKKADEGLFPVFL